MKEFKDIKILLPDEVLQMLNECESTPQNPQWHPEAPNARVPHNVLAHIRIVYDRALETGNINLVIAALFHDLGKPKTTIKNNKGNWSTPGHESVSANVVRSNRAFIESMGASYDVVYEIVKQHMRAKQINNMRSHKVKELQNNVYFDEIMEFTRMDDMSSLTDEEKHRYDNA